MEYMEFMKLKEAKSHGDFLTPISYYYCCIPDDFSLLPMHWHEEMEIAYVTDGSGIYTIDLETFPVEKGDLIIIQPYILHMVKQHYKHTFATSTFVFSLDMLSSLKTDASSIKYFSPILHNKVRFLKIIKPSHPIYQNLKNCFFLLKDCFLEKPYGYELELKSLLTHFLFVLFRNHSYQKSEEITLNKNTTLLIKRVLNHIQLNYSEELTIPELSSLCDFSEYHFMRFFKKHMGMTCIDYINNYRLDLSATLLREKPASIMNIAMDTGFHNISYFNKLFKKKFGMTPSEYRKFSATLS